MYQKYKSFENLDIYKLGNNLVKEIYILSNKFPRSELFGLISQIRRAAISIVLNIAEGSSRKSKEFARFIDQSIGSILEIKACLIIVKDLDYITENDLKKILPLIDEIYFKSLSFKKYLLNKIKHPPSHILHPTSI